MSNEWTPTSEANRERGKSRMEEDILALKVMTSLTISQDLQSFLTVI